MMEGFDPAVVDGEAELAEWLRLPWANRVENVMEILEETEAVAIKLPSTWWGNEALGIWSQWFFVRPSGVSDSGKALFISEGVTMSDAVGYLHSAESARNTRGALTSNGARKLERKAFNWRDDSKRPGPGMPPTDERESFTDSSVPLSVIEVAVTTSSLTDHALFTAEGVVEGGLSDGDISVTGIKRTRHGKKLVLEGDTYNALSQDGDDALAETEWENHHTTFDGGVWVTDPAKSALKLVIEAVNEAGYSVAVHKKFVADDLSLNLSD